ncbi:hypothetical protein [Chryseobacterium candidae]|uniref:Tetratricopeptide repeat protein n=1 Tax=Chryseobacterium candidae TaxID=1978493 RepID=A0ABY2R611_9FLAO|nr:hypothetical protein [Chryseobacterium candidae]THV58647.1 hypothetical protein EK417_13620 [Chryseobacterium candidae]
MRKFLKTGTNKIDSLFDCETGIPSVNEKRYFKIRENKLSDMIDGLQKAKDLMDNGQYMPAMEILQNIRGLSEKSENYRLLFMSYCWYNLGEYQWAANIADELLQKDMHNELASQIKYLSYCGLKDFDKALEEIIRFLSFNEADVYKITLEELLTDIRDGFINEENIVSKIKGFALKYNVTIENPNSK